MKVVNLKNNALLADKARIAQTFLSRLVGLLNRSSLEKGEALILKPACSIHTLFMRFNIDVLFLDKKGKVIALLPSLKPYRFSPIFLNAFTVIELPANALNPSQTRVGDTISISP